MFTLENISLPYWIVAICISLFQAYRGFRMQFLLGLGSCGPVNGRVEISRGERVMLFCIADMLTFLFCTLSGFYAFLICYRISLIHSYPPSAIENPATLIFLLVYGVLGVTGKLPDTLGKIALPSTR